MWVTAYLFTAIGCSHESGRARYSRRYPAFVQGLKWSFRQCGAFRRGSMEIQYVIRYVEKERNSYNLLFIQYFASGASHTATVERKAKCRLQRMFPNIRHLQIKLRVHPITEHFFKEHLQYILNLNNCFIVLSFQPTYFTMKMYL